MAPTQTRDNPANLFMFMCSFFPWVRAPSLVAVPANCCLCGDIFRRFLYMPVPFSGNLQAMFRHVVQIWEPFACTCPACHAHGRASSSQGYLKEISGTLGWFLWRFWATSKKPSGSALHFWFAHQAMFRHSRELKELPVIVCNFDFFDHFGQQSGILCTLWLLESTFRHCSSSYCFAVWGPCLAILSANGLTAV